MRTTMLMGWLMGLVLMLGHTPLRADGMAFKGRDWSAFETLPEEAQTAVIEHKDGVQKMTISVNLKLGKEEKGVWLFPVPAKPSGVTLALTDSLPVFFGKDVHVQARQSWGALCGLSASTQYYPAVVTLASAMMLSSRSAGDHVVAQAMEQWGLRAELLEVRSPEALARHLGDQGAQVAPEALRTFGSYCTEGWSIVAVWIRSQEEASAEFPALVEGRSSQERHPCVALSFPTEKMFYPMKPTAGYGAVKVPLRLHLVGHVEPSPGSKVTHSDCRYFFGEMREGLTRRAFDATYLKKYPEDANRLNMESGTLREIPGYTILRCDDLMASDFSEDLTFIPATSLSLQFAVFLHDLSWTPLAFLLELVALIAITSYVSGGLAGLNVAGQWRGYASMGLCNLLTLGALYVQLRSLDGEMGDVMRTTRDGGWMKGRPCYLITFTLSYALLTLGVYGVGMMLLHP